MNAKRYWIVAAVLALAGCGVMVRSVQVMVVQHSEWERRARRQHERQISVPSARGDISSADGYVLATSIERVAVQLDRQLLPYPELFVRAAAPLLGVDERELRRRVLNGPRTMWLAQRTTRELAGEIEALAPDAVVLVPDSLRVYPLGSLAAPVIGFVGREELETIGRAGFEHHYDELLAGEPEVYLAVNDAVQRRVRLERVRSGHAGYDLQLTLVARLQAVCEAELDRVIKTSRARSASAVVMETRSGTILALASRPSFDPANPGVVSAENWRLRPVQDAYEPGSLVKPIIAAAGLSEAVVARGERFDCRRGGTEVAGHWVRDHAEPGIYTLDEVVAESANVGIIQIAERLEPDALWRALDAFGFGRRTGVGFPAEAEGILPVPRSWSAMSKASLAIGQELTASPLQIAVAYAAIANGGWLLRPRLVMRASDGRDRFDEDPQSRSQVLSTELSARVRRMLETVVTEGSGEHARVVGYRTAGKTGTAQRAVNGRYDDEHHVAWFAGFLPEPTPSVVIVITVENPKVDYWGSTVAAPVFARVAETTMCQLGIAPSEATAAAGAEGGTT